ncbi:MAG: hypothetical protein COV47_02075 [Candidatus Diapherotrites archaeon CG11_big_fil_rev_8_21_14_0_20_37_9]|nr:MAG: hypothetical protein COV47_02075 [Candidatus Diapherotrites archaeon CG11_big_fil_rev_8_21_14_0_20_37_9]
MGLMDLFFGKKKTWVTSEKSTLNTKSDSGATKTNTKETMVEKDEMGNMVSRTTTTRETEKKTID